MWREKEGREEGRKGGVEKGGITEVDEGRGCIV